jgi:hypothetical protein
VKKSLAERLGYRADDRLLIVDCDDLGSSHAANIATYRAMTGAPDRRAGIPADQFSPLAGPPARGGLTRSM